LFYLFGYLHRCTKMLHGHMIIKLRQCVLTARYEPNLYTHTHTHKIASGVLDEVTRRFTKAFFAF